MAKQTLQIRENTVALLGTHREIQKIIPLEAFITYLSSHLATPLLPPGTRFFTTSEKKTTLVIEQPPQVRTIKWERGKGFKTYHLAFPYIIFIITFKGRAVEDVWVFYRNAPLSAPDDDLFEPNLPNIHTWANDDIDYAACLGEEIKIDLNLPLAKKVEIIISYFWSSIFSHHDVVHAEMEHVPGTHYNFFHIMKRRDKRISSLRTWEEATKRNPLFPLEIRWRKAQTTLKNYLKKDKRKITIAGLIDFVYRAKEE